MNSSKIYFSVVGSLTLFVLLKILVFKDEINLPKARDVAWNITCNNETCLDQEYVRICGESRNAPKNAATNLTFYSSQCERKCDDAKEVHPWLCEKTTIRTRNKWLCWWKHFKGNNLGILEGRFSLESNPESQDYQEFLEAMGFSNKCVKRAENPGSNIDLHKMNSNNYRIDFALTVCGLDEEEIGKYNAFYQVDFEFGKEFLYQLCDGRVAKATVTQETERKWIWEEHLNNGEFRGRHIWQFSAEKLTITWTTKNIKAIQYFGRDPDWSLQMTYLNHAGECSNGVGDILLGVNDESF